MTTNTAIPTLTDVVSDKESKVFVAFLLAFFNIERVRDKLKRLNYPIGRSISDDGAIKVTYVFPKDDGSPFQLSLSKDNPYEGRDVIINRMLEKIEAIRQQQRLESAKKAITSSLKPAEVDLLKSLSPAELQRLLSGISS
jgi:hypothetical protein